MSECIRDNYSGGRHLDQKIPDDLINLMNIILPLKNRISMNFETAIIEDFKPYIQGQISYIRDSIQIDPSEQNV